MSEESAKLRMNLVAIQNVDPYAKEILDSSPHVAFYKFVNSEWEKSEIEGLQLRLIFFSDNLRNSILRILLRVFPGGRAFPQHFHQQPTEHKQSRRANYSSSRTSRAAAIPSIQESEISHLRFLVLQQGRFGARAFTFGKVD